MTWVILLLVGFGVGYWFGKRIALTDPKRERLLELFAGGAEVSNDTVEAALGVSDATATRYLEELEKEGKVVQVGRTGRGVVYKSK